jgi:hypothetical protein
MLNFALRRHLPERQICTFISRQLLRRSTSRVTLYNVSRQICVSSSRPFFAASVVAKKRVGGFRLQKFLNRLLNSVDYRSEGLVFFVTSVVARTRKKGRRRFSITTIRRGTRVCARDTGPRGCTRGAGPRGCPRGAGPRGRHISAHAAQTRAVLRTTDTQRVVTATSDVVPRKC